MCRARQHPASDSVSLWFHYVLEFPIQGPVTIVHHGLVLQHPSMAQTDTSTRTRWENIHPNRLYPLRQCRNCRGERVCMHSVGVSKATHDWCAYREDC